MWIGTNTTLVRIIQASPRNAQSYQQLCRRWGGPIIRASPLKSLARKAVSPVSPKRGAWKAAHSLCARGGFFRLGPVMRRARDLGRHHSHRLRAFNRGEPGSRKKAFWRSLDCAPAWSYNARSGSSAKRADRGGRLESCLGERGGIVAIWFSSPANESQESNVE